MLIHKPVFVVDDDYDDVASVVGLFRPKADQKQSGTTHCECGGGELDSSPAPETDIYYTPQGRGI